ncbi:hypothetical protein M758_10G068100 [Ceratodon purpureus]|nr:hypothetical protein M758_10G068100 [Ceratodon purpureus]
MEESQLQTNTNIVHDGDSKKAWVCMICLEELKNPMCTPCGHLFCWSCIYAWLKDEPKPCPMCKSIVLELYSNIIPIYNGLSENKVSSESIECPSNLNSLSNQVDVEIPPCPREILTSQAISRNVMIPSSITTISQLVDASDNSEFGPSRILDQNIDDGDYNTWFSRVNSQVITTEIELQYTRNHSYESQLQIGSNVFNFRVVVKPTMISRIMSKISEVSLVWPVAFIGAGLFCRWKFTV